MFRHFRVVIILISVFCASCGQEEFHEQYTMYDSTEKEQPRIHSIGQNSILVFEKDKELVIPITGAYFADETLIWSITLSGVVPLTEGVDYKVEHPNGVTALTGEPENEILFGKKQSNIINIILGKEYTNRLKTGDSLNIEVAVSDGRERLALERVRNNNKQIEDGLTKFTDELNDKNSDYKVVYHTVSELLDHLSASHNYLTKLKNTEETIESLKSFKANLAAVQHFLSKRIDIPENLNVDNKVKSEVKNITINNVTFDEIMTWSQLERRLQNMQQIQEVAVTKRKSRVIRSTLLSSAYRKFVFYSVDSYREMIVSGSIPINNISAYPLPREETEKLFGEYVADLYFVVRLSVYNKSKNDILVSTGMIKATGRALVGFGMKKEDGNTDLPTFTVPVEVVPQSSEHVYTIVAEGKKYLPREIVFRTLEFIGALGTAYATGFQASSDAIKHAGLFSGVLIPNSKRLFPDPVEAQLSNIVNFTMPNFVKVPRNGSVEHKYLFFSKGDLQAVVSDIKYAKHTLEAGKGEGPKVVYMAFDSMQIPFETVNDPNSATAKRAVDLSASAKDNAASQIQTAIDNAQAQLDAVDDILKNWGPTDTPTAFNRWGLVYDTWNKTYQEARSTNTNPQRIASGLEEYEKYQSIVDATVKQWTYVLSQFDPSIVKLQINNNSSVAALKSNVSALQQALKAVNSGFSSTNYSDAIKDAETNTSAVGSMLSLYETVAGDVKSLDLKTALPDLHGADTSTLKTRLHNLRQPLILYKQMQSKAKAFTAVQVPEETK